MIIYTDDALVVADETKNIIRNQIGKHFVVKKGSIGPLSRHLCGSVRKVFLGGMTKACVFSSSQYARCTAYDVEIFLKKKGLSFPKSYDLPLPASCRPELDAHHKLVSMTRRIINLFFISKMDSRSRKSRHVPKCFDGI